MYTIGANKGDPECQLSLAGWYMTGIDQILQKNEKRAFELTNAAGLQGLPRALYTLGYFYERGIGVERADQERAVQYYEKAAEIGILLA